MRFKLILGRRERDDGVALTVKLHRPCLNLKGSRRLGGVSSKDSFHSLTTDSQVIRPFAPRNVSVDFCAFSALWVLAMALHLRGEDFGLLSHALEESPSLFKPLVKELAIRGHQVDFFTNLPMNNPPKGLTQKIVKDWQEEALKDFNEEEFASMISFNAQRNLVRFCSKILDLTFERDQVSIDLLNSNETYDLVLTEYPVGNEPLAYLAHKFKALHVAIMGFPDFPWVNELSGLPDNPSYMVNNLNPSSNALNFWERLHNTYVCISIVLAGYYDLYTVQQPRADRILRYEGWENRPKLMDMVAETALILMNSHPSTGYPYPRAPHVKEISGMHIDSASQPLPKDLQDFLDDAPHGVIFFSLGSVLNPAELLAGGKFEIFLSVFRKLKQKVMWKIAPGLPEVKDPHIRVQTWYPQQGILVHKNLKMFITHGGLQSMIEAISFGVPCLGIPFVFDQQKDIAFLENIGMAVGLTLNEVTEDTLSKTINEILFNPKFRENAQKRRAIFEDRPRKPVEEAAYWIEYVLRHGQILRPASATMPFYQLYLLDVAATVIAAILVLFWLTKKVSRTLLCIIFGRTSNTVPTKKKLN